MTQDPVRVGESGDRGARSTKEEIDDEVMGFVGSLVEAERPELGQGLLGVGQR